MFNRWLFLKYLNYLDFEDNQNMTNSFKTKTRLELSSKQAKSKLQFPLPREVIAFRNFSKGLLNVKLKTINANDAMNHERNTDNKVDKDVQSVKNIQNIRLHLGKDMSHGDPFDDSFFQENHASPQQTNKCINNACILIININVC